MMLSEFEKLTGLEVTTAEYEKIEAEYMESPDDKAKFCKMWLKKRGLQRLHNARLEEIEHLKKTIEDLEHKLDEEQDWQISHKYGTHYQKTSYLLYKGRCQPSHDATPRRQRCRQLKAGGLTIVCTAGQSQADPPLGGRYVDLANNIRNQSPASEVLLTLCGWTIETLLDKTPPIAIDEGDNNNEK